MRTIIRSGLLAMVLTGGALIAVPVHVAAETNLERQVRLVDSLTEIESLAVVTLRRAAEPEDEDVGDPAAMSADDVLLSGMGSRTILTGDDADEDAAAPGPGTGTAAVGTPDAAAGVAEDTGDGTGARGPLQEAIAGNATLAAALADRAVDPARVVAIEVRGGTSVIVYVDDS
jgi:hypothetical protein